MGGHIIFLGQVYTSTSHPKRFMHVNIHCACCVLYVVCGAALPMRFRSWSLERTLPYCTVYIIVVPACRVCYTLWLPRMSMSHAPTMENRFFNLSNARVILMVAIAAGTILVKRSADIDIRHEVS